MFALTHTMVSLKLRVKVKVIAMIHDKVLSYLFHFTSVFPSYYSSTPSLHSSHSSFLVFILQKYPALSLCTHSLPAPIFFPQESFWIPSLFSPPPFSSKNHPCQSPAITIHLTLLFIPFSCLIFLHSIYYSCASYFLSTPCH